MSQPIHASCVALGGRGVLLVGRAGSGKSTTALRMIALGARLVADDQVVLSAKDGHLTAEAPSPLAGRIECRGVGVLRLVHTERCSVQLVADLDRESDARLPARLETNINSVALPLIAAASLPHLAEVLICCLRDGIGGIIEDPETGI